MRYPLGIALAGVLLLGASQVLLPGLAAGRMRAELERYGTVESVSVGAFPAIELLWGDAESVRVRAGSLRMSAAQVGDLLWKARGVGRIDMDVRGLRVGSVWLSDVRVSKRGAALRGWARMSVADVRATLPAGARAQLDLPRAAGRTTAAAGPGEPLGVELSGGLFGPPPGVRAVVGFRDGTVAVEPVGGAGAGGVRVGLFAARHVRAEGMTVRALPPGGYALGLTGSLR
jgi:hypothetical protein